MCAEETNSAPLTTLAEVLIPVYPMEGFVDRWLSAAYDAAVEKDVDIDRFAYSVPTDFLADSKPRCLVAYWLVRRFLIRGI